MRKRKFKSKALTAAERRLALGSFILIDADAPPLPSWWFTLGQARPCDFAAINRQPSPPTGQPGIGQGGAQ